MCVCDGVGRIKVELFGESSQSLNAGSISDQLGVIVAVWAVVVARWTAKTKFLWVSLSNLVGRVAV